MECRGKSVSKRLSNLIDTRIIARKTNGQNVFSYVNFDEIYTTGVEANLGIPSEIFLRLMPDTNYYTPSIKQKEIR